MVCTTSFLYSDNGKELGNYSNKIKAGFEIFVDEYGYNIKRLGLKKAFINYLRGLPSWLDIPFYYFDIKKLLYSLGFDEAKGADDVVDKLYYESIANVFLKNK